MKIDALGDFNEVIDYYKWMLDFAKRMKPNIIVRCIITPEDMIIHKYFLAQLRVQVNNIGISISQNFEMIDEKNGKYKVKEEYIREAFKETTYFNNLLEENKMSPYEVIKQIRNCLVHGEYDIEFDNIGTIELNEDWMEIKGAEELNIVLNNGRIRGKIPAVEINQLEYIYSDLNTLYSNRTETFALAGDKKLSGFKSKSSLKKYLDSIKKIIVRGKIVIGNRDNIDDVISEIRKELKLSRIEVENFRKCLQNIKRNSGANFFQIFEEDKEKLKQNKEFLEEYIKYIGVGNYPYLMEKENPYVLQMFNENVLSATFENHVVTNINNIFCEVMHAIFNNKIKESNAQLDIKAMSYEGPIVYANMMLGLANYICVFLKEVNNNEKQKGISAFEYHNLKGMNRLKIAIDNAEEPSIVKGIDGTNKLGTIQNTISDYQNIIGVYNNKIRELNRKIKKLNDKNPKKNELKEKYQKEIKEFETKKDELEKKIKRLQIRKNEYKESYDDYTNLFRHLRNSIAHGTYDIDYIEALKKKDMRKIKYTFRDYREEDKEKITPEFELEINAEKLMRIIESVQNRVNEQTKMEENTILSNKSFEDGLREIYESRKRDGQEIGRATYDVSAEKCDNAQKFVRDKLQDKNKGDVIPDE